MNILPKWELDSKGKGFIYDDMPVPNTLVLDHIRELEEAFKQLRKFNDECCDFIEEIFYESYSVEHRKKAANLLGFPEKRNYNRRRYLKIPCPDKDKK